MRSRMLPKYYISQSNFERERSKIFRNAWVFAGLSNLLPENHSFITRKIAGIPIVIQNFKGQLRAFENICLHRGAPLQKGPSGIRPLICAYHAWSYDSEGHVKNIPDCDIIYHLDPCEKSTLKLREFSLQQIGQLLFINISHDPMPIEEQFTPEFIDLLRGSSEFYDSEVMTTTWHANFNWKLAQENLRDLNHVKYVHAKSLSKVSHFAITAEDASSIESDLIDLSTKALRQEMRKFSHGGPEGHNHFTTHFPWMEKVERWGNIDSYFNWLAYPNLHIASGNGGYSFTIENYIPIAPGKTDVEIFFMTGRKKINYADSYQVLLSHMHYSKQILGEDIEILEAIQSGLHNEAPAPFQGAYESKNREIERWYSILMETDHGI
ncbi:ribosomal subunit interface protein [Delftia sp. HK171]|nr:ribosomal subunit interface protein [Delftia sp. HK171]